MPEINGKSHDLSWWNQLPPRLQESMQKRHGHISRIDAVAGNPATAPFAAVLHTDTGRIYTKAARADTRFADMLRAEASVNMWVEGTPELWEIEVDGWLVLGFEPVDARPCDLSPGSADLLRIGHTLLTMARDLDPAPASVTNSLSGRWASRRSWFRLARNPPQVLDPWTRTNLAHLVQWERQAIHAVHGTALLHTGLRAETLRVSDSIVHVVDWSRRCVGAPWVDIALLVPRLIAAGHAIDAAEAWAVSVWPVDDDDLTAFSVTVAGQRAHGARVNPTPGRTAVADAAHQWMQSRLDQ